MRALLVIALVMAATGAGIAAASAFVTRDGPFEAAPDHLVPGPAESLVGARAPDPDGGPDWAVRTYVSRTGALCVERGRFEAGVFGDLDEHGALQPRPEGPTGVCADPAADRASAAVDQVPGSAPRTVVFGASLSRPESARVTPEDDPPVDLEIGARGSFIAVFTGLRRAGDLPLTVTFPDGHVARFDWTG